MIVRIIYLRTSVDVVDSVFSRKNGPRHELDVLIISVGSSVDMRVSNFGALTLS